MVKVKVCGITNSNDASAALLAGAGFLGFIIYPPSPRAVEPAVVSGIVSELHSNPATAALFAAPVRPLLVGVFVNETAETTANILDDCGLDLAQLSGDEQPAQIIDPASPLFGRSYKAVRPKSIEEGGAAISRYLPNADAALSPLHPHILVDTPHGKLFGGSGETGDWGISAALAKRIPGLMLAGGLTAGNVANAVRRVRPFAVDVASGIEATPGHKDHAQLRAFIHNAKNALRG